MASRPEKPGPHRTAGSNRDSEKRPENLDQDLKLGSDETGDAAEARHLKELLEELAGTEHPSAADEERVLVAASLGDAGAQERILKLNLEMVMRLAAARAGRGLSVGDLFQEGSLALMEAIRGFDSRSRDAFQAEAERMVAAQMDSALDAAAEAERADRNLIESAESFQRVQILLAREFSRQPTVAEMAAKLEWTPDRVELVGELVEAARRRHDEELLQYLETDELEAEDVIFREGNGNGAH